MSKVQLKQNDIVRVRRANNTYTETCYVVTEIDGFNCKIGEYAGPGRIYSPQPFDISLIERVDQIPTDRIR